MRPEAQERIDRIVTASREARDRLADTAARAKSEQATARSRDNLVQCTVGAGDGILDLAISPRAMRAYTSTKLASTIMEVIAEANASLQATVMEHYREVLGDSFDPKALADPDAAAEMIKTMSTRFHGG